MDFKVLFILIIFSAQVKASLLGPLLECKSSKSGLTLKLESKTEGSLHIGKSICPFKITQSNISPRSLKPTVNILLEPQKGCHPELFLNKGFLQLSIINKKSFDGSIMILKDKQTLPCTVTKSKKKKVYKMFFK